VARLIPSRPRAQGPRRRRGRLPLSAALALALLAAAPATTASPAAAGPETPDSDITMIQANLLSPQSDARFRADVAEIMGYRPDLVTYNEVAFRRDEVLAPDGYALWREDGRYQRTVPVAWRTDRWTAVARGSVRISNYRKRPPGREVRLGIRWANWVTLKSPEGRTLSLVSTHFAPKVRGMPDLRPRSAERLAALVKELGSSGPVLVGGDFNIHYRSSIYPEKAFASASMKTTYELLGTKFPTGDHGGYTIDWVVVRGTKKLQVDQHFPVELNSDHDAVVAGLSWTSDPASSVTTVQNDPSGDFAERRAVSSTVRRTLLDAQPGELVQVATEDSNLRTTARAMQIAYDRGVRIQVTTRSQELTTRERVLAQGLGAKGDESWVRRCGTPCATWEKEHPPTVVLRSDSAGSPELVVELDRRLRTTVVTHLTRATLRTGPIALEAARQAFAGG